MIVSPGSSSISLTVQVLDDTGLPVAGLVAANFPPTQYVRAGSAASGNLTLSDLGAANSAFSANGVFGLIFGYYRLDVPNAAWTTVGEVAIAGCATNKQLLHPPVQVGNVPADLLAIVGNSTRAANLGTAANSGGNLTVNVQQIAGCTTIATTTVTFPTLVGTSTFAVGQQVALSAANVTGNLPANVLAVGGNTSVAAIPVAADRVLSNLDVATSTLLPSSAAPANFSQLYIAVEDYPDLGNIGLVGLFTGSVNGIVGCTSAYTAETLSFQHGAGLWTTSELASGAVRVLLQTTQPGVTIPTVTTLTGFAAGAITATAIASSGGNAIADYIQRRHQEDVANSTTGDSLSKHSLYGVIQGIQRGNTLEAANTITIRNPDGSLLGNLTLTGNDTAAPIVAVGG